ncbi:MAG TPA: hypothetical protein VK943_20210 [Arenibaculum sp.]|nr:hypothetical protein [Arenibaculum sp.]
MTSYSEPSRTGQNAPGLSQIGDKGLAAIIYFLYIAGFFTGLTALIGVILAHVNVGSAPTPVASHYRYQIRTFWWGLAMMVVGSLLTLFLIGYAILLGWFVWTVYRIVKGLSLLNRGQAI